MDLPDSPPEHPRFVVFPRGMEKDAARSVLPGVNAKLVGVGEKRMKWKAKYGSVGMTSFDVAFTDGVNEYGLAGHLLVLAVDKFEPKDDRPEMGETHWLAYMLDNFRTVQEAVAASESNKEFRLVPVSVAGLSVVMNVHLALEDPTGDSAVFEMVNGKLVIHHGPQYRVMTNDPTYDEMLKRMKKYQVFGGTLALPGGAMEGEDRFVRLSYYFELLPEPKSYREAIAGPISLIRSVQIPLRDPEKERGFGKMTEAERLWAGSQTNWISAIDLTNNVYYINSATSPSLFWVKLKDLDLGPRSSVRYLDPYDIDLQGDVGARFKEWKAPAN
jgi:penicillin V acylase-like amidase (Ntn superfamily)